MHFGLSLQQGGADLALGRLEVIFDPVLDRAPGLHQVGLDGHIQRDQHVLKIAILDLDE